MKTVKPTQSPEVACITCGNVVPRYEIMDDHGTCHQCTNIKRWYVGVWSVLFLLIAVHLLLLAGTTQAAEPQMREVYDYTQSYDNRHFGLKPRVLIRVFESRMDIGLSEIVYNRKGEAVEYRIILAPWTFTYFDWRATVRHELCHLAVARQYGHPPNPPHNATWRACARRHNVPLSGFVLTQ